MPKRASNFAAHDHPGGVEPGITTPAAAKKSLTRRAVYVYFRFMKATEAVGLLQACEQELRRLLAEAAAEGDYASVQRIADWAKALAALGAEAREGEVSSQPSSYGSSNGAGVHPPAMTSSRASDAAPVTGRRVRSQDAYPKFFRRGDELVKVGWSKKERKEYSHRAPRKAVDAVAAAVKQVGARGKLFNGDALIPLKDPSDGAPLPDYQVYVALAWLTNMGVLEQRGRRAGYALVPQKQVDSTITAAWPGLPEWRG